VLVADDQSMVRAESRMLLSGETDIEVVAEASNGLEAVHQAARFAPAVSTSTTTSTKRCEPAPAASFSRTTRPNS